MTEQTMTNPAANYYTTQYTEETRLFKDNAHRVEYLTTIRYFDKLFTPGSSVLDACAGAGAYAFYLAQNGYNVTAGDLVPHHVNIMQQHPSAAKLADIIECNVLDLSMFADASFDVVLCMGALYHLYTPEEQQQAIAECTRVCKPGGLVLLAYIPLLGAVFARLDETASNTNTIFDHMNDPAREVFVCNNPCEIDDFAKAAGLEKLHEISTDGPIYYTGAKLNDATPEDFQAYMDFHYVICESPGVISASLHGLWIGKKHDNTTTD